MMKALACMMLAATASPAVACELRMEEAAQSNTLLVRAAENCAIAEGELIALIETAVAQKPAAGEFSIALSRLVKYPWLTESVAAQAARVNDWDAKRGHASNHQDNAAVARILMQILDDSSIASALDRKGLRLSRVSVEKVLVQKRAEGRLPFDALVWLRVVPK